MIQFTEKIEMVEINPCVTVPSRVSRHFGLNGYVPVVVYIEKGRVPSTLVPIGGGVHRLYINGKMLQYTDSGPGDRVTVRLELDTSDRSFTTPDYLSRALASDHKSKARWNSLAPSKRKEVIRYLSSAKTTDTRDRNLAKLLTILRSESGNGVLCGIQIAPRKGMTLMRESFSERTPGRD